MGIPNITSTISKVTVFREGAAILRRAVIKTEEGGSYPNQIKLGNLPLTLDDGSIRVKVEAKGENKPPIASDVRVMLEVVDDSPDLPPPTNEALEAAERETQRLRAELAALERACSRLQSIDVNSRSKGEEGKPPPESPLDARLSLITFRTKEIEERQKKIRRLQEEIRVAEDIESDLRYRHELATSARQARENELRKTAVISLQADENVSPEATVLLEYHVPGARWAPTYSVIFDNAYEKGTLAMRAVVAQRSGEDWSNVELALSTADKHSFTELPELKSIRIGKRQPEPAKAGWRPPPVGTDELYSDFDKGYVSGPPKSTHASSDKDGDICDVKAKPEKDLEPPCPSAYPCPPPCDDFMPAPEPCPAPQAPPGYGGGMPMQPPGGVPMMSAPCPPPSAPPSVTRAGAVIGNAVEGMFDRMVSASAAPFEECEKKVAKTECATMAPRAKRRSSMMKKGKMAFRDSGGGDIDERARREPFAGGGFIEDIDAPTDLLDYGSLRMASASSSERGKLRPASRREIYLELLNELNVKVSFDVVQTIRVAVNSAISTMQQSLPVNCVMPATYDNFSHIFAADESVDVPSDGQFHSLPLFMREADVELKYVVVPRVTSDAFRMITFKNPMDAPMLAGPADISVGDQYLLTTRLSTFPPRGRVELGLGVEQGIKVARNTSFDETESGLLIGELSLHHEIKIEVANMLKREVKVEVRERIPHVAANDDEVIKVETVAVEPPWEEFVQPQRAILDAYRWNIELDAGEEKTLTAEYEIHLPAKYELVGGNRREA